MPELRNCSSSRGDLISTRTGARRHRFGWTQAGGKTPVLVAALLVVIAGGILSVGAWTRPVRWTPDSVFYEAQAREVGGENAAAARKAVFAGPLGRSVRDEASRVRDPRWVAYAAPFFRRRWVTPVTAAAVKPLFGDRSLLAIST